VTYTLEFGAGNQSLESDEFYRYFDASFRVNSSLS
jgi:hypothetical protein